MDGEKGRKGGIKVQKEKGRDPWFELQHVFKIEDNYLAMRTIHYTKVYFFLPAPWHITVLC